MSAADWSGALRDEALPPLLLDRHAVQPLVVVGGGVVGVSIALRLQARGRPVLLLERRGIAAEASRGNAGALAFSDIQPLASPRILRQVPRWLLDPLGPLALRPAYLPRMLPWLWRFWRASRPRQVEASTRVQAALLALSAAEMPYQLALGGASAMLRRDGNLHLYDSEAHWRASLPGWALRERHGIAFEHLHGAQALAALQPGLAPQLCHATFVPHWQTVEDPQQLVLRMAQAFAAAGGRIARAEVQALRPEADAVALQLAGGQVLRAQQVVVAAGAWSHRLAATLGERIPLETERGYNTSLPPGALDLRRQLTFADHGFVVTPIGGGVRVGGAVEFGGLAAAPDYRRADAMLAKARRFLPALKPEGGTRWMGFRPSLPDSLPALGPARADARVIYAFGHGHLGLTQSAATAALVERLLAGEALPPELAPLSPRRFG